MRRFGLIVAGVLLVAAGCSSGVSGPQRYAVGVDAASPAGKNFQYSTFFPSVIKARPGDSITFVNRSTQAPHTITFGVAANRSNQPQVILPTGKFNPAVQQPCFAEEPPKSSLTVCPHNELPGYGGTGYWNSGILVPSVAPKGRKRVTLELASSIKPGQYQFLCLLHGPMAGVLNVVAKDDDREKPEVVVEDGQKQLASARTDALGSKAPKVEAGEAAAGWSVGSTAVNRFEPATLNVKVGDTVQWEAYSKFEPHVVAFGPKYQAGNEASASFAPEGLPSGSSYSGGASSSGVFGVKGGPFPAGPFSLKFTKAGTYTYVCTLHPGMKGTVKVT